MDKEEFASLCATCPVATCEACGRIIAEKDLRTELVYIADNKTYHEKCWFDLRRDHGCR